jgi:hypothetical protein
VTRIEHVEQRPPPVQPEDDDEFEDVDHDEERLQHNHFQMGGGNRNRGGGNQNRGNNDLFAKVKFTMIPFAGSADPEAYLDWELAVNQKFNSHQVPEEHRVRLATSEFTRFALFWWNDLCNVYNAADIPQTCNVLKHHMKSCFALPYYQRDLRMKLQTLKQGDKSVEAYYLKDRYGEPERGGVNGSR